MLRWALGFFIVALIAAILGFGGIAVAAAGIAKIIFCIFLVLFVVSLIGLPPCPLRDALPLFLSCGPPSSLTDASNYFRVCALSRKKSF